ncbi:hypothetical protein Rhal01_00317 [Rubritalea halochordaticola]|uniref:Uncharacterized protein n=1 Tax=Rubritalea halochordaticola TaxID=714537 RepID=A0ABP9UUJ8_9BACT
MFFISNKYLASLTSILFLSGSFSLSAQEGSEESSADSEGGYRKIDVRFVALGHRRTAKFERSKEAKKVRIKAPDGTVIEETIPAGVPLEIMGKEFEYLPPLIYIPERRATENNRLATSPLILNACTKAKTLSYRPQLDILLRRNVANSESEMELKKYASVRVGEKQSEVLVAMINRTNQKEGWEKPLTKSFDTSPDKLPGGSLLLFNSTPFSMEFEMPMGNEFKTYTLKPLESKQYKPNTNNKNQTIVKARLVAPNGKKMQVFYSAVKLKPDTRAYLFSYYDPRKGAIPPAGIIQFHDEVKLSEPSQQQTSSTTGN